MSPEETLKVMRNIEAMESHILCCLELGDCESKLMAKMLSSVVDEQKSMLAAARVGNFF